MSLLSCASAWGGGTAKANLRRLMHFADTGAIFAPIVLAGSSPLRALVTNLAWSRRNAFSRLQHSPGRGELGLDEMRSGA